MVSGWPQSPFWYQDLFFGIEIPHAVVQHLDHLLPGINPCVLLRALTSCKLEVDKISIPTKINSVHTMCIVKTSGFTRGVCKNRGFY